MTFGKSTFRAAVIAVAIAVVCTIPAVAMAVTGDIHSPEPIALPGHGAGTLLWSSEFQEAEYWYMFNLDKGQTISATITADPAKGVYLAGMNEMDLGSSSSDPAAAGVEVLSLLAPRTGTYYMVAAAPEVADYSMDIAIAPAKKLSVGWLALAKSATHAKKFTVTARLTPDYNGLTIPIRFFIEKKGSNGKYKAFADRAASKISESKIAYTTFSLKTSLSKKGTYRIRARFKDAAHASKYTRYKTIKIK